MRGVCVIGAGPSGLTTTKILHERGIPVTCYEKGSGVGGLWRYQNDSGTSAAYRSLHINTSRRRTAFSDFPMPEDWPDFPHHSQILAYFEAYVERFGFGEAIRFRTEVTRVEPLDDGAFEVTTRDLETGETQTLRYGAVLVANGHHWDPRWPEFPGSFEGTVLHAHQYKTPELLVDKRVLVVGVGNSGCDIATESAHVAAKTFLSTRRGAHVVPKYLLGKPLDEIATPLSARLPFAVQRFFTSLVLRLARGKQENYGFPTPTHPFGSEHPTVSSDLLPLVGHGRIVVKPNIEQLSGDRVRFVDGSEETLDVIVYATGYKLSFPFFPEGLLQPEENRLPLYRHVVPPGVPNLYFIGLIQPLGSVMPLAEAQARWVADLLDGRAGLPPQEAMNTAIAKQEEAMRRRYVHSPRHTIQVDYFPYLGLIERERRRGRKQPPRQALSEVEDAVAS